MTKECECSVAGWCNRHHMLKSEELRALCLTREDYRALYDKLYQNPSIAEKAVGLATAIVKHVVDGLAKTPEKELRQRLEICGSCDQLKDSKCQVCGCYVSIKASWRSESCPIGKWSSLQEGRGCEGCNANQS